MAILLICETLKTLLFTKNNQSDVVCSVVYFLRVYNGCYFTILVK